MPFQLTRSGAPILEKDPTHNWEAGSVLNPSVIKLDDKYHMFYRATNDTGITEHGRYMSSIGHAVSADGVHFERDAKPLMAASELYENGRGCEDPRVVYMDGTYYIYYTAVEAGEGTDIVVRLALATSADLKTVTKHGIIGPRGTRSKAGCLLPEKVNGKYLMYFTDMSDSPSSAILAVTLNSREEILNPHDRVMAALDDFDGHVVLRADQDHSVQRGPELGAVPIKTSRGWLLIYCGANHQSQPRWTINAALLDLADPTKVIAHLPEPILTPETDDEARGLVHSVAFPSGAIVIGDELYVYYGGGDQDIRLATCPLADLLGELARHPVSKHGNEE